MLYQVKEQELHQTAKINHASSTVKLLNLPLYRNHNDINTNIMKRLQYSKQLSIYQKIISKFCIQ